MYKRQGFTAVMISGVPSFCEAAARLGISLGEDVYKRQAENVAKSWNKAIADYGYEMAPITKEDMYSCLLYTSMIPSTWRTRSLVSLLFLISRFLIIQISWRDLTE